MCAGDLRWICTRNGEAGGTAVAGRGMLVTIANESVRAHLVAAYGVLPTVNMQDGFPE
jgi:hypothetical protein